MSNLEKDLKGMMSKGLQSFMSDAAELGLEISVREASGEQLTDMQLKYRTEALKVLLPLSMALVSGKESLMEKTVDNLFPFLNLCTEFVQEMSSYPKLTITEEKFMKSLAEFALPMIFLGMMQDEQATDLN